MLILEREVQLEHTADFLQVANGSRQVLVASRSGDITLLDVNLDKVGSCRLESLAGVAVSPTSEFLAFATEFSRRLIVTNAKFDAILDAGECYLEPPGACFLPNGDLCTVRYLPAGGAKAEIRTASSRFLSLISVVVEPCYTGQVLLSAHPTEATVAVEFSDGQHGSQVLWLFADEQEWLAKEFGVFPWPTKPVFHPRGNEFLMLEYSSSTDLYRIGFPNCRVLSALSWPDHAIVGEPGLGEGFCYLSDTHALVIANEGRLFVVDLLFQDIPKEVTLPGHEPRPAHELYPSLLGDMQIVSDVVHVQSLGATHGISAHTTQGKSMLVRFNHESAGALSANRSC